MKDLAQEITAAVVTAAAEFVHDLDAGGPGSGRHAGCEICNVQTKGSLCPKCDSAVQGYRNKHGVNHADAIDDLQKLYAKHGEQALRKYSTTFHGDLANTVKQSIHSGAVAEYPKDHKAGMRVPKGGSSCASCEYLEGTDKCNNKYFIKWNGSKDLPVPADEYCSDWYEPAKKIEAGGLKAAFGDDKWDVNISDSIKWITVNGQHIPIHPYETVGDEIRRHFAFLKRQAQNPNVAPPGFKEVLQKAISKWSSGSYKNTFSVIKKETGKLVVSGKKINPTKSPAETLLYAVRNGKLNHSSVYRGIAVKSNDPMLKLKTGKQIQLTELHSFTLGKGIAQDFVEKAYNKVKKESSDVRAVLFEVKGGVKGLNISSTSDYDEREFVTNGKFTVKSVKPYFDKDIGSHGISGIKVVLKQKGVL